MGIEIRNRRSNSLSAGKRLLAFLLCACCFACGESSYYEQFRPIEKGSWSHDTEYYFTFDITDASVPYDLSVEVRNNNLYPYQNLWLFTSLEKPTGTVERDTVEYQLADDYGKWLGDGISLYHSSFPLRSHYLFADTGTYTVSFRQGMRTDHLNGIRDIGLKITTVSSH